MSHKLNSGIAVIGIDIGKNSFHVVGHDKRGAIMLRQKWSRGQVEARLANLPPCLIGMEACVGAHHLSRKLTSLGHDTRLMPTKYVRPYSRGTTSAMLRRSPRRCSAAGARNSLTGHYLVPRASCRSGTCASGDKAWLVRLNAERTPQSA
jgi:hypothetical protein